MGTKGMSLGEFAELYGGIDLLPYQREFLYHIDMNMPLPPVTRRVGKAPELGMPYGQQRVKPTLLLRAVEPLPGLWMCEARENEDGPRVSTADLGYPLFTSKDGALAFSGDVCAAWWRRYA